MGCKPEPRTPVRGALTTGGDGDHIMFVRGINSVAASGVKMFSTWKSQEGRVLQLLGNLVPERHPD
jgi:hypothetical protein